MCTAHLSEQTELKSIVDMILHPDVLIRCGTDRDVPGRIGYVSQFY